MYFNLFPWSVLQFLKYIFDILTGKEYNFTSISEEEIYNGKEYRDPRH